MVRMRLFSLETWRPRHLLAAWGAYWAGLAAVTLGPPALAIMRLRADPDTHGSVAASIDNGVANLTVALENGASTWSGSASLLEIALWAFAPPLLLWIAWVIVRPRRQSPGDLTDRTQPEGLPVPDRPGLPQPGIGRVAGEPGERRAPERVRERKD